MSEEQLIQKTLLPLTKNEMVKGFRDLGIQEGDNILVHSSLSSLGWVVGKEIAVIEALLECVGKQGTVIMPAQSGDWSNPDDWAHPPVPDSWKQIIKDNMPNFDPLTTPTRMMGRIADAFWHYPGSVRSNHPQVSFSANGKNAKYYMEDHCLDYGLSDNGPLGKLYQDQAKILLIGVGYGNCTSIHLAEVRAKAAKPIPQASRFNNQWCEYIDLDYDDEDFEDVGKDFEKEYTIPQAKIGNATCRLINLKDIVDYSVEWFKVNRKIDK